MNKYIRPHRDNAVLLTIDTQNDFANQGAPAEIKGTIEAVPQMEQVLKTFRSEAAPIIHVIRLYRPDGSNVDPCRKAEIKSGAEIVRPKTDGAELVEDLKPSADIRLDAEQLLQGEFQEIGPNERIMYKPRWSAFYGTKLDDFLRDRSINTVVICGCNFPNCPRTTVYEASERDYRIVFVPDATSGTYPRGLVELENIGVALMDAEDASEWLTG